MEEDIYIEFEEHKLYMKRFKANQPNGLAAFLLHGSIEDGRIFYSKSGKGLAPFLRQQGYEVFVPDLRGKGNSTPKIDKHSEFGQRDTILKELPVYINKIEALRGKKPEILMAHSWGGVLSLSYLARFDHAFVKAMVFFGTKRDVRVQNPNKWFNIDLVWKGLGNYLTKKHGYFPAAKFNKSGENESKDFYYEVTKWVKSKNWVDHVDDFNYADALQKKELPPLLSITGSRDTHAGHPKDVKRLLSEIGDQDNHEFRVIGKRYGHKHNYNHINLLTHPMAPGDHFMDVLNWLKVYQDAELNASETI